MSIRYISDDSSPTPSGGINPKAAFHALFDDSAQGVIVHRQHKGLYVNSAWAAIHGHTTDEVMTLESIMDLISPRARGNGKADLKLPRALVHPVCSIRLES